MRSRVGISRSLTGLWRSSGLGSLGIAAGRVEKVCGILLAIPLGIRLRREGLVPTYLDVGGRGGPGTRWSAMARLRLIESLLVEPEPLAAEELEKKYPRSRVIRHALGDREGTATLYVTTEPGRSSLLQPMAPEQLSTAERHNYSVVRTEEIRVVAWDDLTDVRAPVFVKIDVQGFELHVLEGMKAALLASVVALQVEVALMPVYEDQPRLQDLWSWLDVQGFSLCDLRALGVHERGLTEFNAFFVRRELSRRDLLAVAFWRRLLGIPSHALLISRSD